MIPRVRVLLVVVAVLCGLLAAAPAGAASAPAKAPRPPKPVVSKIKPASGPVAGGTKVVVKGKNLSGATKVLFGKVKGKRLSIKSAKKLTVVAPAQAKGKVHVRVVTKGGKSKATAADFFTYVAPPPPPPPPASPPSVTGVTPGSGTTAGGTLVTVSGTNLTGATSVTFGGIPATGLTPVSATALQATSPAHAAGSVDVRVTTPAGVSPVVAAGTFSYDKPPPAVTAVEPTAGPTAGGTEVTVTGTDLTGATSVTFGGTEGVELAVASDTSLTVVSPPHAAGVVDIRVSTPEGISAQVPADDFEFLAPGDPPTVTAVAPTSGPTTGGTDVTVTGTDFAGATSVTFGGTEGTDLDVVSDTTLTVVSPPHGTGVVNVRVETADGTSAVVAADEFTYLPVESDPRAYAAPLPGDADTDEPGAVLNAVDCPSPQQCFAVGGYLSGGQRVPLVEQRTGEDTWDFFRPDLPTDAAEFAEVDLVDVDCATPAFCVAIGTYLDDSESEYHPLIETWDGEEWTPSSPAIPGDSGFLTENLLFDVECPADGTCVAVGHYDESVDGTSVPLVLALSAGTWTAPSVTVPAGSAGELFAVDCPTAAACVAVGEETTSAGRIEPIAVTGPGPWTVNTSLALPPTADPDDPDAGLREVSCSAAGACVAVGAFRTETSKVQGLVEVLASSAWTAAEAVAPLGAASNPDVRLLSVSCASTCAAVGNYAASAVAGGGRRPVVVRVNGTTPVVERGEVPGDPAGELSSNSTSVTCGSDNRCIGVGSFDEGSGVFTPLLSSLVATAWTGSTGPVPADISGVLRAESSTLDGDTVAAVGFFTGENGTQQALIMLDLPL